ncbi:hypothetical protein ACFPN0_32390 [Kitasatospora cinereorecta]
MRVDRVAAGRRPLVLGKEFPDLLTQVADGIPARGRPLELLLLSVALAERGTRRPRVEDDGQGTPARPPCEGALIFLGRRSLLAFQNAQRLQGREVGAGPLPLPRRGEVALTLRPEAGRSYISRCSVPGSFSSQISSAYTSSCA